MKYLVIALTILIAPVSHAGIFDTIGTIIGGHVDDIRSRGTADQIVDGYSTRSGDIRTDDPGQDFLHNASGTIEIREGTDGRVYVQLASNFTSTPGPDYHVYVSTSKGIKTESDFNKTTQVELGRLLKGSGASYYEIKGISPEDIKSVTIWCKAFGEFIGSADIS